MHLVSESIERNAFHATPNAPTLHPDQVYHAVQAAMIEESAPLTAVLDAAFRGHPRQPFSEEQLIRGFESFVTTAQIATMKPLTIYQQVAGVGAGGPSATKAAEAPAVGLVPVPMAPGDVVPVVAAASAEATEDALKSLVLHPRLLEKMNEQVLRPAWQRLRGLKWADWAFNEGNPFVVKITKNNATQLGVPTYFTVISKPMDLTRMDEKLKRKLSDKSIFEGAPPACYTSVEDFINDAQQIVLNAKTFNCPPALAASVRGGDFPHPSTLPAAYVPKGSVYAMAFDFEAVLQHLTPAVVEQWKSAERQYKMELWAETTRAMQHSAAGR